MATTAEAVAMAKAVGATAVAAMSAPFRVHPSVCFTPPPDKRDRACHGAVRTPAKDSRSA